MRACALVPAYEAERSIAAVVRDIEAELPGVPVLVIDDGSRDRTAELARAAGATVLTHRKNCGKGAAIRTGLAEAKTRGLEVAVTVDADGQHPARSARVVLEASSDPGALVLGVRDLARAGAPAANQWSNGVSNYWLSMFLRRPVKDTQCGLRRYPVRDTLALGVHANGYAFEAEVLLRAAARGVPFIEVPIDVVYPLESERITHFDSVRDPARIVGVVVRTLLELRVRRALGVDRARAAGAS